MPSANVGRANAPLCLVKGRPFAASFSYNSPSGGVIDMTGFTIAGTISWSGGSLELVASEPGPSGTWTLSADEGVTDAIPEGARSKLDATLTDTAGNTTDIVVLIEGVTP